MINRILPILTLLSLFLFHSISNHAQQISPSNEWATKMMNEGKSFKEIKDAFYEQWEGKEYVKGKGWKQFHRWENFWETRLLKDGSFPDFGPAFQEYNEYMSEFESSSMAELPANGNWLPLGPFDHETTGSWSSGTGRVNCVVQDPLDPSTIYIGTPAGGVWKTTDAGSTWDPISDDLSVIGISGIAVHPTNTDIIYISTGDDDGGDTYSIGIWKSIDGGATWNQSGTSFGQANKILIDPDTPSTIWVAGNSGLYKSSDSGVNWNSVLGGNIKDIALKPNSPTTVYAATSDTFYYSTNGGTSWSAGTGIPTGGNRIAIGVTPANNSYVYVLAADSGWGYQGVYRSTNSGVSFTTQNTTANVFNGSSQAWYDMAMTVDDNNANRIVVGVLNLWRSTDGGTSWTEINSWSNPSGASYTHADIHYLNYYDGNLYCGSDGGVYKSTNDGNTFTDLTIGVQIGQFYKIGSTPNDATVLTGGLQDNGGYAWNNNSWKCYHGADGMEAAVSHTNSNHIFGMIQYGGLYRSTNGGFNLISEGSPESGRWITPMQWDPNGNRVVCGYNDLWEYNNTTDAWNQLSTYSFPAQLRHLEIFEGNSDIIYMSTGSNLFKTTDGGTSVSTISIPFGGNVSSIEVDPINSLKLWITQSGWNSGNNVFYTSNGGSSWSNVSNGLPNLPTNQIKYDATNDGLYLAMDIGVYYRNNILNTWIPYNNNLPNVIVRDVEINEASGLVRIGTYGRGVWESGIYDVPVHDEDIMLSAIMSPLDTYCETSVTGEIEIRNVGTNNITSLTIEYYVDANTPSIYNWTGALAIGENEIVTLPTLSSTEGVHTYTVNLVDPNGLLDGNLDNNTLTNSFELINGWGANLIIDTDCWGGETSWILTDATGSVIDQISSGDLSSQSNNVWNFCLAAGCYDLTMEDTYGDGLNGTAFGCAVDGNYTVTDDFGNVLVQMGLPDFDFSITHNFCVPVDNPGCDDALACNYDPSATINDGSCVASGCGDDTACNYDAGAACFNIVNCDYSCLGCNDNSACNYDAGATVNDGSCTYPGCTDPLGCNYDNTAGCDDLSCNYTICYGCTDSAACNYFPFFIYDDGSCEYGGCTDSNACNYNSSSACDDGSCDYSCVGCLDNLACNFNGSYTIADNTLCTYPGCDDPLACNYDSTAGCSDLSCSYSFCYGCTDSAACNYYPFYTFDNGSCEYGGCADSGACNYDASAGCDDGSCDYSCVGCTDTSACNFDANNTISDNTLCVYPGCTDSLACNFDANAGCDDLSCDYTLCYGCTDSAACNYFPFYIYDNGTCEYSSCAGCTDSTACNYDSSATLEDGSCEELDECGVCGGTNLSGCTNPAACNFDSNVNCDDGSCLMMDECGICGGDGISGCTDIDACNYDVFAACDDGSCEYISCAGCIDSGACNYDPIATLDNGTCLDLDECGVCGGFGTTGCIDTIACNYDPSATCDDGTCDYATCLGCTDSNSCNYDASATLDDGSCLALDECGICGGSGTLGCMDSSACNFDSNASCDDGTCTYAPCGTCIGDGNHDGYVDVLDLVSVSSNFGCEVGCWDGDANFDDVVDILDLIAVSSNFSVVCD